MFKWLCHLVGIDYRLIKSNNNIIFIFSGVIILSLSFTLFGFYYAIYNATENILLSFLFASFFSLFILNIYRLVFSISEGELSKYDNFWVISKFIFKRGFIIIGLSLFISKSLEVYVFKNRLEVYVDHYKNNLKRDYNKTLEFGLIRERLRIEQDYKNDISDLRLFNKFSKEKEEEYNLEKEKKLIEFQQSIDEKNKDIDQKIRESNFFITKIKLLNNKIPESWLLTIIIVIIFLSPFYVFLLTPLFSEYDTACFNISNKIIIDEYLNFKARYSLLMKLSTGNKIQVNENFEDPPFNSIKKKSNDRILKKGSLLKWIEM